jgi:hypothetical protein
MSIVVTQNETGCFERSISAPAQETIPTRMPKPPNEKKIGAAKSSPSGEAAPLNVQSDAYPIAPRYAARYSSVDINQMRETSRRSTTMATLRVLSECSSDPDLCCHGISSRANRLAAGAAQQEGKSERTA